MLISIETLFTVVFTIVDDWYQSTGKRLLGRTVGAKPEFSDSEMLTLMLGVDFFEFTSERRFVALIRANYRYLFPKLLDQSQFNRRARSLRFLLNELRKHLAAQLGVEFERHFLLDTTPIIAVGYRRDKHHSNFYGSAQYGYCAARRMKYYGYKLVMLTTLDGTPYAFELVPANTDERDAADEILDILVTYLNDRRAYIPNYKQRRAQRQYIGSAQTEKADDLIVSRRQKHQGMHWSQVTSDSLAALRTLLLNGGWELYWQKRQVLPLAVPLGP
jgi:hypothetical protein